MSGLRVTALELLARDETPVEELSWRGLPIGIEFRGGETREVPGVPHVTLPDDWAGYGYFIDLPAEDGDSLDVIAGPRWADEELPVWLAVQLDPNDGSFFQYKTLLGFESEEDARKAFLAMWPEHMFGGVEPVEASEFRKTVLPELVVDDGSAAGASEPSDRRATLAADSSPSTITAETVLAAQVPLGLELPSWPEVAEALRNHAFEHFVRNAVRVPHVELQLPEPGDLGGTNVTLVQGMNRFLAEAQNVFKNALKRGLPEEDVRRRFKGFLLGMIEGADERAWDLLKDIGGRSQLLASTAGNVRAAAFNAMKKVPMTLYGIEAANGDLLELSTSPDVGAIPHSEGYSIFALEMPVGQAIGAEGWLNVYKLNRPLEEHDDQDELRTALKLGKNWRVLRQFKPETQIEPEQPETWVTEEEYTPMTRSVYPESRIAKALVGDTCPHCGRVMFESEIFGSEDRWFHRCSDDDIGRIDRAAAAMPLLPAAERAILTRLEASFAQASEETRELIVRTEQWFEGDDPYETRKRQQEVGRLKEALRLAESAVAAAKSGDWDGALQAAATAARISWQQDGSVWTDLKMVVSQASNDGIELKTALESGGFQLKVQNGVLEVRGPHGGAQYYDANALKMNEGDAGKILRHLVWGEDATPQGAAAVLDSFCSQWGVTVGPELAAKFNGRMATGEVRDRNALGKRFLGRVGDVEVWLVKGDAVRDRYRRYDIDFTEGGNWKAYPWIPAHEVWLEDTLVPHDAAAILVHELVEARLMESEGLEYDEAHERADAAEEEFRSSVESVDDVLEAAEAFLTQLARTAAKDVVVWHDLRIVLEAEGGSKRPSGDEQQLPNEWRGLGYFEDLRDKNDPDEQELDVVIGPGDLDGDVHLGIQLDDKSRFRQFKVFLAFADEAQAEAAFKLVWAGDTFGGMWTVPAKRFRKLVLPRLTKEASTQPALPSGRTLTLPADVDASTNEGSADSTGRHPEFARDFERGHRRIKANDALGVKVIGRVNTLGSDSEPAEDAPNTHDVDTGVIGNLLQRPTALPHTQGTLQIPGELSEKVDSNMLPLRGYIEVPGVVIQAVFVPVVDDLRALQWAIEDLLHDHAMLSTILARCHLDHAVLGLAPPFSTDVGHGQRTAQNRLYKLAILHVEVEPRRVNPPHPVKNREKLRRLTEAMKADGWDGRPVLAYRSGGGYQAITGSHRIAAARAAGLERIPVLLIEDKDLPDAVYTALDEGEDNYDRARALEKMLKADPSTQPAYDLMLEELAEKNKVRFTTRSSALHEAQTIMQFRDVPLGTLFMTLEGEKFLLRKVDEESVQVVNTGEVKQVDPTELVMTTSKAAFTGSQREWRRGEEALHSSGERVRIIKKLERSGGGINGYIVRFITGPRVEEQVAATPSALKPRDSAWDTAKHGALTLTAEQVLGIQNRLPPKRQLWNLLLESSGVEYPRDFVQADARYERWKQQYAQHRLGPKPVYVGGETDGPNRALSLEGPARVSGPFEAFERLTRNITTWDQLYESRVLDVLREVPGLEALHFPDEVYDRLVDKAWESVEPEPDERPLSPTEEEALPAGATEFVAVTAQQVLVGPNWNEGEEPPTQDAMPELEGLGPDGQPPLTDGGQPAQPPGAQTTPGAAPAQESVAVKSLKLRNQELYERAMAAGGKEVRPGTMSLGNFGWVWSPAAFGSIKDPSDYKNILDALEQRIVSYEQRPREQDQQQPQLTPAQPTQVLGARTEAEFDADIEAFLERRKQAYLREGKQPGEKAVVVVRVPSALGRMWPEEITEKNGPPHFTAVYIPGPHDDQAKRTLEDIVARVAARHGPIPVELEKGVEWFKSDNPKESAAPWVAHKGVHSETVERLAALHWDLVDELEDAGFEPSVRDEYKAHATLAYCTSEGDYHGPIPEGGFTADAVQLWGWPDTPTYRLSGKKIRISSDDVLEDKARVAGRRRVKKRKPNRKRLVRPTWYLRDGGIAYDASFGTDGDEIQLRDGARVLDMSSDDLRKSAAHDPEVARLIEAVQQQAEGIKSLTALVQELLGQKSGYDAVRTEDRLIVLNPKAVERTPARRRWLEAPKKRQDAGGGSG
jgi:hypothetical protein